MFELPTGDTVAPDASFVSRMRWQKGPKPIAGKFLRIVPDLIVELISPNSRKRDREQKHEIYEKAGVRECWILDLRSRNVLMFWGERPGGFAEGREYSGKEQIDSKVLPELQVCVEDLLVE